MCGGYQLLLDGEGVSSLPVSARWRAGHREQHSVRNSIRPTNFAPVLVHQAAGAEGASTEMEIAMMKWGLIPSWTQANAPTKPPLINARSETVTDLPSFSGALRKNQRCVVVSTGFFEWEKGLTKTARKTPFLINVSREGKAAAETKPEPAPLLYMAGVYDIWTSPEDNSTVYTFAICTTPASQQFEWLHHRLPCILPTPEDVRVWLDVRTEHPERLLRTLHSGLVWRQMSQELGRPVGEARSRRVKPDVRNYFGKKNANSTFAKPSLASQLQSPIRKKTAPKASSSSRTSPRKAASSSKTPPRKAADSKTKQSPQKVQVKAEPESPASSERKASQKKITSFFRKK